MAALIKHLIPSILLGLFILNCFILQKVEAAQCEPPKKVIFCYYSSWAVYRPTLGEYHVENIDPFMCTHLVYAFAGLNIDLVTFSLDSFNDLPELGGEGQYHKFRQLREQNPCLKIMLSIGGWNEGSEKYSLLAESEEKRNRFADHLLRYLVYYGFDGVDLDWEYPAARGGIPADRENHVLLLQAMKDKLAPRGRSICIAVGAATSIIDISYDVQKIANIVDYVLVMTYDYNRPDITTHVAPLYRKANDVHELSIDESMQAWMDKGCPANKLVLGLLTSGRSYNLTDPTVNGLGAKVSGPGLMGEYTKIDGFISYYEVCERILLGGWKIVEDDLIYVSNYITQDNQWVTYDDVKTITIKTEYALQKNFAGVMIWSIDTDDFHGFCDFEYLNSIQRAVKNTLGM